MKMNYTTVLIISTLLFTACADKGDDKTTVETNTTPTTINPNTSNDLSNITAPILTGELTEGTISIEIDILDANGDVLSNSTALINDVDLIWSFHSEELEDGAYVFDIKFINSDLETIAIIKDTIVIDTTAVFTINTLQDTFDNTPTFSGTLENDIETLTLTLYDNQTEVVYVEAALDLESLTWELTLASELADANYSVSVYGQDVLGNEKTLDQNLSITIDTEVSITRNDIVRENAENLVLQGALNRDVIKVSYAVVDSLNAVVEVGDADLDYTNDIWKKALTADLENGEYEVTYIALDALGNTFEISDDFAIINDFPICNRPFDGSSNIGETYTLDATEYIIVDNTSLVDVITEIKNVTLAESNVSFLCTTQVTSMASLFKDMPDFNASIGNFDTINVSTMANMFRNASTFNQSVENFNTAKVTAMQGLFWGASSFNQPVSSFHTEKVTMMNYMFANASSFNQPLDNFSTPKLTHPSHMFTGASSFNQSLDSLDFSSCQDFSAFFQGATDFNQSINELNTSSATNMYAFFQGAESFNHPLPKFITDNVENFSRMFMDADHFNQDISAWNTEKVTSVKNMFNSAADFDQDISSWTVDAVNDSGNFGGFDANSNVEWTADEKPVFVIY